MGADILIQSIGFKAKDRFLIDQEWATTAFAQARRAIKAMDKKRLAEINARGSGYTDVQSCKQTLLNDVAEVEAAALGSHRQATTVQGDGQRIILLLSGGTSWGDSPTALFESMSRLMEAEVFPDARWPKET